jgi:hypothetical protein
MIKVEKVPVVSFLKGNGQPVVVGEVEQVKRLGSPGRRRKKKPPTKKPKRCSFSYIPRSAT